MNERRDHNTDITLDTQRNDPKLEPRCADCRYVPEAPKRLQSTRRSSSDSDSERDGGESFGQYDVVGFNATRENRKGL